MNVMKFLKDLMQEVFKFILQHKKLFKMLMLFILILGWVMEFQKLI